MKCPGCDAEVVAESVYCHQCGARLDSGGTAKPTASPPAASGEGNDLGLARRPRKDDPEVEVWEGGYDPRAMLGNWLLCGAATIGLPIVVGLFSGGATAWWITAAALALLWVYHVGLLVYRRLSVRYRLTSQRFFHETGILRRVVNRVELLDIDDIVLEQGIIDRLVGVGVIRIASGDRTHPLLRLPGIGDAKAVFQTLDRVRRAEQVRRSLHLDTN